MCEKYPAVYKNKLIYDVGHVFHIFCHVLLNLLLKEA